MVNILGIDYYNGFGFIFDIVSCFIIFGNDVVVLMVEEYYVWEVFFNILVLVYIILFFIIGFFGNVVVLYVYIEKWGRSFIWMFILGLVILDLVNCFVMYFMEIVLLICFLLFDFLVFCKVICFVIYGCNMVSGLVFIVIVVDRY